MHMFTHTHIHTYIHIFIHTHTHTHTYSTHTIAFGHSGLISRALRQISHEHEASQHHISTISLRA